MLLGKKLWYDVKGLVTGNNLWNMKAPSLTIHYLWHGLKFWKVGQTSRSKTVVSIMPRFCRQCQRWPWPLTPQDPKSIGFLLSSSTYIWSLKVIRQKLVCIVPRRQSMADRRTHAPTHPSTHEPKIIRVPPLNINNLHVKFESDLAKTVVCAHKVKCNQQTDWWTDGRTYPLTHKPPHYYIPSNAVARG